ncbi:MAG TPA: hypothetical protein VMO00_08110 [Methylomirabilota bacterium]|nr:hypothetical protein [Methylomirabilota bacterium]
MRDFIAILKKTEPIVRWSALLVLLYLIPSFQAMLPIDDPDIWWRLRTGEWIVENHAVPVKDFLSTQSAGKPWIEYSWAFEALVYALHAKFGLLGLLYFVVAMALIIAFATHMLVRRAHLPFSLEIALVALALAGMKGLMTPRPWLFTILFFSIELTIIAEARHSNNNRILWILPVLFFLWANVHIQFIYGLAALFLLLADAFLATYGASIGYKTTVPYYLVPKQLLLVALICIGATMLTPYHYLLYQQIFEYTGLSGAFQNIAELLPMFFRSPDNWIVLFLTLTAAFVLGWQRTWLPYHTSLLLMGAFVAFRVRRDAWFLLIVAVWIISDRLRPSHHVNSFQLSSRQIVISAVAVGLAIYFLAIHRQITEEHLQTEVETQYPLKAVSYVKSNKLSGPLFNDYDWGGFLIWSLRELPVSVDGRLNLYGDEGLGRSLNTWRGGPHWDSDSNLLKANLIIAQKDRPLTSLLRLHPHYKIVYEDNISAVIVRIRRN